MTTGFRRSRRSAVLLAPLAAGLIAALTLLPVESVRAEPSAAARQNPQRQLAALQHRMTQATEAYNVARIELRASQAKATALRLQLAAQRKEVRALQARADVMAAAAYRGGNLTQLNSMLSADGAQTLLDQLSTLVHLSTSQRVQLTALSQAQRRLEAQRAAIGTEVVVQTKREATLRASKTAIEADLRKARALAAAAAAIAERATRSRPRASVTVTFPVLAAGASGRGAIAVRFAQSQLGKPYLWGADGPGSYDCSGLTLRAWGAAGVSLPHSSRMQYGSSPKVSRSQLRPGDLVFFYSPISHVGIFVGGNTTIGAPQSGDVVKYQSISTMNYVGATRPG